MFAEIRLLVLEGDAAGLAAKVRSCRRAAETPPDGPSERDETRPTDRGEQAAMALVATRPGAMRLRLVHSPHS